VELAVVTRAAMEGRTVLEWDKDDIDALGILKVDVLGLGMLSCIRRAFDLMREHAGQDHSLASLPQDCSETFAMLRRADSLGVFQVESRAQMNMLPRLRPREFYDLVVQVAIVRPGPIQGDMVHPYLRRKQGIEEAEYPSPAPEHGPPDELRRVLEKTLGVPLFQEQAMQLAIVAAAFSPEEADQLRRAMATFKMTGGVNRYRDRLVSGMVKRGYERDFAERVFKQIEGFGSYGFPESHAASFAHLVYASSWIKCHHPAVFACALLNSQPMGFYAPAQIVRDAREHGVEVRPVDVNRSVWDCTLEAGLALRLGPAHGVRPGEGRRRGPAGRARGPQRRPLRRRRGCGAAGRAGPPRPGRAGRCRGLPRGGPPQGHLGRRRHGARAAPLRRRARHRRGSHGRARALAAGAGGGAARPGRGGGSGGGLPRARASRWAGIRWRCCGPRWTGCACMTAGPWPPCRGAAGCGFRGWC
jgi:hypothetical protein